MARLSESPPYAADEIRAALVWTRRAADRELDFAETLVLRMPAVFTALEAGRICRSKAWVFADLCADVTPEQAEVVCTRLLPRAGGLTTGELAARIKKLAIALDPAWAARRYATAVRERNVIGYLNEDGTATVTGSGLPVDKPPGPDIPYPAPTDRPRPTRTPTPTQRPRLSAVHHPRRRHAHLGTTTTPARRPAPTHAARPR